MDVLGHSHIAITMDLYSHVMPTALREAAEAIDQALGQVSSSGTRLTNEFRYVLDMIILAVWAGGWFRAAAFRAGVRGWGQGSAGRPTA
jgi:predicted secreted protein